MCTSYYMDAREQAESLQNKEFIGKSDPFCVCTIVPDGVSQATPVARNTLDPEVQGHQISRICDAHMCLFVVERHANLPIDQSHGYERVCL
jgi:hypothetical protein